MSTHWQRVLCALLNRLSIELYCVVLRNTRRKMKFRNNYYPTINLYGIVSLTIVLMAGCVSVVWGHGRLVEPPSRSTMWRYGYDTPVNYMDNQLYCGGFPNQWQVHDGKCGVCGDPWQGPRDHEAGGKYARGIIVRRYPPSSNVTVVVELTAPHRGYFEFRLCPNDDPRVAVTHACLDRYPLEMADGSGIRYSKGTDEPGYHKVVLRLPKGMECAQCVLQWKYNSGNSWGTDGDGNGCVGCGPQEQFYGCADIAIGEGTLPDDVTLPYWRDEYELLQTTPDLSLFDRRPPGRHPPSFDDYPPERTTTHPTAGSVIYRQSCSIIALLWLSYTLVLT